MAEISSEMFKSLFAYKMKPLIHAKKYLVFSMRSGYYIKLVEICDTMEDASSIVKGYLNANQDVPLNCYIQEQEIITLINDKL